MYTKILFLCLILTAPVLAQKPPPPLPPEARQFDFWIGEWDLIWQGGKGTNTITAILDSAVIQEAFDAPGFKGRSLSTFHRQKKMWHQT